MREKYTIIRLQRAGEKFELLVHPRAALEYKMGKKLDISKILAIDEVFVDVEKGMRASTEKLLKAFGTSDVMRVASIIAEKGKLQLTAEQRKELIEKKRRQIIATISRNYVDPRTKLPPPPLRLEQAMAHAHVSVDPFKGAEEQVADVVKALLPLLPLKMERTRIAVKVPAKYVPKTYGVVKGFGEIKREEWKSDGSWIALVELPAGLQGAFLERVGKATKNSAQVKILGT